MVLKKLLKFLPVHILFLVQDVVNLGVIKLLKTIALKFLF
jgi:hypothetical protein